MMYTNDLKSGTRILLRNGDSATLKDNKKGNIRMAEVEGLFTEIGSIYSYDIVAHKAYGNGKFNYDIVYTGSQNHSMAMTRAMGF